MNKVIRIPLKSWYDSLESGTFNWSMFMHYIVDSINAETDDTFKVKYCEYKRNSSFFPCIALPLANKANVQTSLRPIIYQDVRDRASTSTSYATISNIVSGLFVDDVTYVLGGNTGQKSISYYQYPTSNTSAIMDISPLYNAFVISINTDYLDEYGFYLLGYCVDNANGSNSTPVSAITQELLVGTCKEHNTDKTYNYYMTAGSSTFFQILEGETELSKNNYFGIPQGRFRTIIGNEIEISDFKMLNFYDENLKYIDNSDSLYQDKFSYSNLGKYPSGVIPKIMKIDGVDYDGIITSNKPKFIVPSK